MVSFVWTVGVRSCIVCLLDWYRRFNIWQLSVRGLTFESEADRRVVCGTAWEEYCDTLKAAGASLLSPGCPQDPFTQAEGYRYLSRLVRVSLEAFMECADPHAPTLVALANGSRDAPVKIGSDNPDNVYQSAIISGEMSYVIKVKRGTVKYLGFGTQSGSYGSVGGLKTVDYKEASEFESVDGEFEIHVSSTRPPHVGNWLQVLPDPQEAMVIVRQTREDHENEVLAQVKIECVDGPHQPSMCSAIAVEKALRTSGMFVAGAPIMFARWANGFQKHCNELPLFDQETSNKAGGDPNIRYFHSYWKLKTNEALVITTTPPQVETWNFQLNNHWMESLDYRYYGIHVNKFTARYRKDGSIVIYVSAKDPGVEYEGDQVNWINTVGHDCGTMCFRWIRPVDSFPQPATKVVSILE